MEIINLNTNNEAPEVGKLNVFQKIAGVVVSPSETMKAIAAKPTVIVPIIMFLLMPLALYILRYDLYEEFMRNITQMSLENSSANMTPEQIAAAVDMSVKIGIFSTPLSMMLNWLIGTAILFGIMKIFKGEGNFKQYLSVTGYAYVIMVVYYLLCIPVSYMTGTLMLNSSLALIVPHMKESLLYGILRGLDFFSLWYFLVIGIGAAAVSKVSKAKVYTVVGIIFIVSIAMAINTLKFM
ncbi:MAG: YIP1 family protein [Clostridia bacterium]|nr:YIP1 family protein [Clostridia bacterium]